MKDAVRRWLREPLLHFLLLGLAIFMLMPDQQDASSRRIAASRADLVRFMQGRARFYDDRSFAQIYDGMSPAERSKLLEAYARQEALYREAKANHLDETDTLINQRLVQQMELLLREQAAAGASVTDADVERYFAEHRNDYRQPVTVSLTHVFIDKASHGAQAEVLARQVLARLVAGRLTPESAIEYGDRFPYQRNYADVTALAVAPELGGEIAGALATMPVRRWSGPYRSELGLHLVWIDRRQDVRAPELATIRERVRQDALVARRNALGDAAVRKALDGYEVVPASDVGALAGKP